MMLWESFEFKPNEVALMIASAGFLCVAVQFLVRRVLGRTTIVLGFCSLFISANAMSWSPNTGSGIVLSSGIILLAVGWGCLRPMLSSIDGAPRGFTFAWDDRVRLVAWLCGVALGATFFYYHERTSFASGGLVVAFAALCWKIQTDRANRGVQTEAEATQTETAEDGTAWMSR
jgi:hypothetical protein